MVSWKASLQYVVALSNTESEYVAVSHVIKKALSLKGLISEVGINQKQVKINCDSQSAIYLTKNQMTKNQMFH